MENIQNLFKAVEKGDLNILEKIIPKVAGKIDEVNEEGLSALAVALYNNQPDALQILINNNAKLNVKGKNGKTTLEWAREQDKSETAEILLLTDYMDRIYNTAVWWDKHKEKEASCDSCGGIITSKDSTLMTMDEALSVNKYTDRIFQQAIKHLPPSPDIDDHDKLFDLMIKQIKENSYSATYTVCSTCAERFFEDHFFGKNKKFITESIDKLFKEQL